LSLKKLVRLELTRRCGPLGFKRRREGWVIRFLAPDATLEATFGATCYGDSTLVTVHPVIALKFASIDQLGIKLSAYPDDSSTASLSSPITYLMPPALRCDYDFRAEVDNGLIFDLVIQHLSKYAVPLFEPCSTVQLALEAIEQRKLPDDLTGIHRFVPLALFALGRKSEALAAATRSVATMDVSRGNGKEFARFVQALAAAGA
jgi:hypothetical protein